MGEVTEPYQKITLEIKDIDKTAAILDNKTDSKLDINTKLKRTGPGREDTCQRDTNIPKMPNNYVICRNYTI